MKITTIRDISHEELNQSYPLYKELVEIDESKEYVKIIEKEEGDDSFALIGIMEKEKLNKEEKLIYDTN